MVGVDRQSWSPSTPKPWSDASWTSRRECRHVSGQEVGQRYVPAGRPEHSRTARCGSASHFLRLQPKTKKFEWRLWSFQLKFFHRKHLAQRNGIVPREEATTPIDQREIIGEESIHSHSQCRSLCLQRRRQGKSRREAASCTRDADGLTVGSYGLFKATDKKMLKNEELAAELGRPEKVVEM